MEKYEMDQLFYFVTSLNMSKFEKQAADSTDHFFTFFALTAHDHLTNFVLDFSSH